jgi:membrane protein YqaA with SNARE-associated domain
MGRVRDWSERLVSEDSGKRTLAFASFLESTIVPIPLEALVAPLMVAHPRHAWRIALAILLGCLAGALLFYFVALWLFDPVVRPALESLGLMEAFEAARSRLGESGLFWAIFLVSASPVPFQLATLGAGAVGGNVFVFMAAVATSRALRYYGLAALARLLGPRIQRWAGGKRQLVLGGILLLLAIWGLATLLTGGG